MGREAVAYADWKGQSAEVKAIAEATEVILRGAIKARVPRAAITALRLEGGLLTIDLGEEQLRLNLGTAEAARWHALLLTPPPSLAVKLGVSSGRPAFVLGEFDDLALTEALSGARVSNLSAAAVLISVIVTDDDLARTLNIARDNPGKAVWCVYPKGKTASPGDSSIRLVMRNAGFRDSKSCAVSERLTATRYALTVKPIEPA